MFDQILAHAEGRQVGPGIAPMTIVASGVAWGPRGDRSIPGRLGQSWWMVMILLATCHPWWSRPGSRPTPLGERARSIRENKRGGELGADERPSAAIKRSPFPRR